MANCSDRLKLLRAERKMTQKEVADSADVSLAALQNYENGSRIPTLEKQLALASFFGVSVEYLRGESDDRNGDGFELHAHRDPSVDGMALEDALGMVEQLSKLARLHDDGKLTDDEFAKLKKKIIG